MSVSFFIDIFIPLPMYYLHYLFQHVLCKQISRWMIIISKHWLFFKTSFSSIKKCYKKGNMITCFKRYA